MGIFRKREDQYTELENFSWSQLKSVLDTRLVSSTTYWILILPVLMVVFNKIPASVTIFPWSLEGGVVLQLSLPFNWYLLYFSAVLFSAARVIYIFKCPDFLRRYSSAAEAIADGITAEIASEKAVAYLRKYQKKKLHPLRDEYRAIEELLKVLINHEANINILLKSGRFSSLDNYPDVLAVMDIPGTDTFEFTKRSSKSMGAVTHSSKEIRSTKLLIWRLIEAQEIYAYRFRLICSAIVLLAILLVSWPFVQGFLSVYDSFLTG